VKFSILPARDEDCLIECAPPRRLAVDWNQQVGKQAQTAI
jgi:hypothetical protein